MSTRKKQRSAASRFIHLTQSRGGRDGQNLLQFIRKLSEAADLSVLMKNLHCAPPRNDADVGLSPFTLFVFLLFHTE